MGNANSSLYSTVGPIQKVTQIRELIAKFVPLRGHVVMFQSTTLQGQRGIAQEMDRGVYAVQVGFEALVSLIEYNSYWFHNSYAHIS